MENLKAENGFFVKFWEDERPSHVDVHGPDLSVTSLMHLCTVAVNWILHERTCMICMFQLWWWSFEFEKEILTAVTLGWDDITCWCGGWASRAIWADERTVVVTGELRLRNAWVCGGGWAFRPMLAAIGFHQLLQLQSNPVPTSVEEQIIQGKSNK